MEKRTNEASKLITRMMKLAGQSADPSGNTLPSKVAKHSVDLLKCATDTENWIKHVFDHEHAE